MTARKLPYLLSAVAAAALLHAAGAQAAGPAAIEGTVSSAKEGNMEGVLVTAKMTGAHMAVTVVSDEKGHYAFPADRLEPGHYRLSIRAVGYIPDGRLQADVADGKTAMENIRLKTTANIAPQMTSAEWMLSMPGSDDQKSFLENCVGCHTLSRPVTSAYNPDQLESVIKLMGTFAPGSVPGRPQKLVPGPRANRGIVDQKRLKQAADYIASINLSKQETWDYKLQTLPRPTGRGTHVIITTYDLARPEAMPHDVIYYKGKVWYSDFGSQYVGEMDPKTGKVTDIPIPVLKPEEPKGLLELKPDPDGNIWASMMYQGGVAEINPETMKVKTFAVPKEWQGPDTQESMVSPSDWTVDNWVWTNDQQDHSILRVNPLTGKWDRVGVLHDQNGHTINGYDIITDKENNLYLLEFGGTKIGRITAKNPSLMTWNPELPHARPRRGHFDEHGMLWYAEYGSNAVGRFDPQTGKITEWQMPVKWQMPYDAEADAKGNVWTASMLTDRIIRLDPKTGQSVVYLLPDQTNMRRVDFDNKDNALWVGSVHGNKIVKLEPLD
jgi:streptogramin lyase